MSVLIKGMEMPKACYECRMYEADIYYCFAAEREIDIPSLDEGRCSFCPLIELHMLSSRQKGAIDTVYERTRRIINHYPYIHIFGKWYLIRRYTYPAKRWSLWKLIRNKQ